MAVSHFHCPACNPVLTRGSTKAVCGATIPRPINGNGQNKHCPACTRALQTHKH